MKTYNISRIPDGFSQPTYDELLLSGYTQGYEDGYNRGTEECKPFNERYFTIESRVEGIVTVPDRVNYYRRNFQEWVAVPSGGTLVDVGPGDTVEMKGTNYTVESLFAGAAMPDEFITYGNILSLTRGDDFADVYSTRIHEFQGLFDGQTGLTDASNLILQATVLGSGCYGIMFRYCSSLVSVPALPAMTLADACYINIFLGCTSITTPPELPARVLTPFCYYGMFTFCSSLTTAPALPVMTLANSCYEQMFDGCTSLTTAPDLPATTLVRACYNRMFQTCPNLNYVKCLATDISAELCTGNWLNAAPASGTFVKKAGVSWTTGASGIPFGWTIQDA